METEREMLRHVLATLAYRGSKTLRDAPPDFARFAANDSARTPVQTLAHMSDLLDWALSMAEGKTKYVEAMPLPWNAEVARFHASLETLDQYLTSDAPLSAEASRLLQGPLADALTHVGQLAMMRRLSGAPIRGENYFVADVTPGRLGPDQPPPRREFD